MCNVLHLDETSLVVTAQAGITFDALERALAERGLTIGAVPSWARARTLGALLAAPRPSEASPRLGRFVGGCVGIQALLPDGTEVATRLAPRKATGPDLMHAIVGARGTLGLITAATLRIGRRQETRQSAAFAFPTLPAALSAARALLVRGGRPGELSVSRRRRAVARRRRTGAARRRRGRARRDDGARARWRADSAMPRRRASPRARTSAP